MSVIVQHVKIFDTVSAGTFMIYPHIKFHMLSFNGLLSTVEKAQPIARTWASLISEAL
jgi:hypothetical protein